jgi:outer membrane protein assembly factor BamB
MRSPSQAFIALILLSFSDPQASTAEDWPQWRGPNGTGSIQSKSPKAAGPPVRWSRTENIAWRTPIEGRGHSTPVVSGSRVIVTTAVPFGDRLPPRMSGRPGEHDNLPVTSRMQFRVLCIDKDSGTIRWNRTVHEALPIEGGHVSASLASASPIVDDQYVFAMFGSHGLYCLDLDGKKVWEKQLGIMHSKHGHGEGASPTLYGDTIVVNWDHEGQSFVVALNRHDGNEIWKREREEVTSWSSPIVIDVNDQPQVVICGTEKVRGYDLRSGETIWECGGLSANIVATPVYDRESGILVVGSSYEIRKMLGIQLADARGNITDSEHVIWSRTRGTPYVPSFLLVNGGVYFLGHYQNVLTRIRVSDGREAPGPMRLGALGSIYASPVSDGKHVFVTDLRGATQVITATDRPKVIALNQLGENVSASLAIVDNSLFIRSEQALYRIENKAQ